MARLADIVVDASHPASLARFWEAALEGYRIAPYDDVELARLAERGIHDPEDDPTVLLEPEDGGPRIFLQAVPDSKSVKNRVHLDLRTTDLAADVHRMAVMGAWAAPDQPNLDLLVMLDPEGNEFCLVQDPATARGGETPDLYLTCGLPGGGKTSRAETICGETGAVWLGADQWICDIWSDDAAAAARDDRRPRLEGLQWLVAERLLVSGRSVVVDWGLWTREERLRLRGRGRELGARVHLEFVDAPLDELRRRVAARNLDPPPGTFHITDEEMLEFVGMFEPPEPDEF